MVVCQVVSIKKPNVRCWYMYKCFVYMCCVVKVRSKFRTDRKVVSSCRCLFLVFLLFFFVLFCCFVKYHFQVVEFHLTVNVFFLVLVVVVHVKAGEAIVVGGAWGRKLAIVLESYRTHINEDISDGHTSMVGVQVFKRAGCVRRCGRRTKHFVSVAPPAGLDRVVIQVTAAIAVAAAVVAAAGADDSRCSCWRPAVRRLR